MTEHPITPPPELVQKIADGPSTWREKIIAAYRAGADQELEECREWMADRYGAELNVFIGLLLAARRPKPLSLKEQALQALDLLKVDASTHGLGFDSSTIRRALESLPD